MLSVTYELLSFYGENLSRNSEIMISSYKGQNLSRAYGTITRYNKILFYIDKIN